jgi:hypothetical protein
MSKYKEGQTATNPDTGEKFIFRNGTWERMPLARAETLEAATEFDQPMVSGADVNPEVGTLPEMLGKLGISAPSPGQISEALPGLGSAVGATAGLALPGGRLTSALLAGLGGGVGEVGRQAIREMYGYVPATGMAQEALDLDPSSAGARALDVATEVAGGAAGEGLVSPLLGRLAKSFRRGAVKSYRSILDPRVKDVEGGAAEKLLRDLDLVIDDLPAGSRGRIRTKAGEHMKEVSGPAVEEAFDIGQKSSYKPAWQKLSQRASKEVETLGQLEVKEKTALGRTLFGEPVETVVEKKKIWHDPVVRDPEKHTALREAGKELRHAEVARRKRGDYIEIRDVWKRRVADDTRILRAQGEGGFTKQSRELAVKADALRTRRDALSNILHDEVKGSELIDSVHSAWAKVHRGTKGQDPGMFPVRWVLSRYIPGNLGATAGFVATKPAFWGSITSKTLLKISRLLEAGNEAGAVSLLRAAEAAYTTEGVPLKESLEMEP